MPGIDFSAELNPQQAAAATAPDGPMLVLAAAGTGKTRTIVYRVAYLVENGVPTDRILLLTFTNRAAGEMLERAEHLVGRTVGDLWGGTFHHMANRILRRNADRIGFKRDYTILDQDDSRTIIRDIVKNRNIAAKELPKPDVLLSAKGIAVNTRVSVASILERRFAETDAPVETMVSVLREYDRKKTSLAAMDFDDLLVNGLLLLKDNPDILDRYRGKFRYVLVDEYQDTNDVQAEMVDLVAAGHLNVLVVGDDFQAIYSWRGASSENIMTFPERYPKATTYKLEINYRSTPEILDVANACISGNRDQFQKTLRPTRESHAKPVLARMRDGDQQGRFVLEQIARLQRDGFRSSEIAVLYRAHYHAMELQLLLTRSRVPYAITSGMRFFEQAHVKDVCAPLRIAQNPNDETAFSRLVQMMPRVGRQTAQKLWDALGEHFDCKDSSQRDLLRNKMPAGARDSWAQVEPLFATFADEPTAVSPADMLHGFIEDFYDDHAANIFEDAARRGEDIRELMLFAGRFKTVEEFLSEMALFTNLDTEASQHRNESGPNSVRLSTVHQAKGLEWRAVIVLWMTEGMFPSGRTLDETGGNDTEERRLFYVAITRAKDELVMCMPEMRRRPDGGVIYLSPSRFVSELPSDLIRASYEGAY